MNACKPMILPRTDTLRHSIFTVARHKFAWPGGYLLYLVMDDGDALCPHCVRENAAQIARSTRTNARDGWQAIGYENAGNVDLDPDDMCAHCNKHLAEM
jgi:hypothetical protein